MANQNRNPKNNDSVLFKKLTRMFSGPLTNRRTQTYHKLRRTHLNVFSNRFKSLSGQTFKKRGYNPFQNLQTQRMANQNRAERYREFDQMEYEPLIAAALDIYADEMTTSTKLSPLVQIDCQNEELKLILENFYYNVLNVEHNLYYWVRTMCKYGDFFLYCDIDPEYGVNAILPIPCEEIERLEGEDQTNPHYVQFQWNSAGMTFENWQILHFRILGHDKYAPYGTGILEPTRRVWRQLVLLEDSVMAYRIVRSPERRVFYIDVGSVPPQQVDQYMEEIVTGMKRHQIVDEDTGRVDLRYNPLSVDEDYFIPVRGQSQTKIETLAGGQYTGDIDDIKYLQAKLIAGLKIPFSYLVRDENSSEDKETLAQKDIRFARTILKLQKPVVSELEKIGVIHLVLLGYSEEDALSFGLSLNNPSKLAELQELEEIRTKVDAASGMKEAGFSHRYIMEKVFDKSHEEIIRLQRERKHDMKFESSLEAEAEAAMGGLDDLGDLGGDELDMGGEGDPFGGGDDFDLGGDEGESDLEDNELLATPGKRDEYTTPRSKGKTYRKVKDDKRDIGANRRSMQGSWSKEKSRATARNVRSGMPSIAGLMEKIKKPTILERKMDSHEFELRQIVREIRDLVGYDEEKDGLDIDLIEDAEYEEID